MSKLSKKIISLFVVLLLFSTYFVIPSNAEINIPGNVQATAGSTSITLSWDEVAGATAYDVEADGVVIGNTTGAGYEVTELVPETEHTYRVRAKDGEMVGEWSEPVTVLTIADMGQGTEEDPFIITTRQQLESISDNPDAFYILGNNIDLENEEWVTSQYEFSGSLDGNGYTISNLKITRDGVNNVGLFGKASGATIRNLKLNNVDIRGADNVGGLVGNAKANTVIEDCSITGQINGAGCVGGIVGKADNTTISKCYSTANVAGTNEYIGGIVGYNHYTLNIQQCCSNGNVSGKRYVGGILGGKNSTDNSVRVENCCSLGAVTVTAGFAGGVIGYSNYANIINCFSAGQITGAGSYIGGISGYKLVNTISDCYFDGIVNNNLVAGGVDYHYGKLTSGMKAQVTFKDWDFENTWNIDEGNSYPYLRNVEKPANAIIGETNDAASGTGTSDEPYLILTKQQLINMRCDLTGHFILGDNIDLQNEEWITSLYEFTGSFDGNGYTISNLKITRDGVNNIGLFGKASGAAIRNLNLNNVDIRGADNVGGLVGFTKANTVIEDCSITGAGQIKGAGSVGGIVGKADNTTISKCYSTVNVTGTNEYIGGIAGYNHYSLNIQQCCSNSNVSGKRYVGGILGGKNSTDNSVRIENCCSLGAVTVTAGFAGGVIGYSWYAAIKDCYAAGQISGAGSYKGGITGDSSSNAITNCYFDGTVMGFTTPTGQAKTTEQLMQQATFINWDFSSVWNIDAGSTYPFLRVLGYPKEFTAVDVTNRSISLSWIEVPNASSYDIEINGVLQSGIMGATHTFTDLTPGTKYKFRIRTRYDNGESNWSPIVTVITLLDTPENVVLVVSEDHIQITWDEVEMAQSYMIEVDGTIAGDLLSTSYLHQELAPNGQHTYRIKASNDITSSEWTDIYSAINWAEGVPGICLAANNWIYDSASTDDIELLVKANNVSDMYTIQMDLEYDTRINNMADDSLNYLLWSENENTYICIDTESQSGRIKILASKTGGEEGQTGDFDVLSMRLRFVAGNMGSIKVHNARIVDSAGQFIEIFKVQDLNLRIFSK